jgi:SAM-dependent methyltransferase
VLTVDLGSLKLSPGSRVLDVGCGEGRHLHGLYSSPVTVCGLELDLEAARRAHKGCRECFALPGSRVRSWAVLQGDCLGLPLSDESLDGLICCEVLEHLADYERALREMHRVLRPGGRLAVSVPRFLPERVCWALSRGYHSEPGGHVRIFKAAALRREVEGQGFRFLKQSHAHALHTVYWWLKCLRWEKRDSWLPIRCYHRFLVWDLLKAPKGTRLLERMLNPLLGKSVVLYFTKVA